ncbi:MAG: glucose-1-phosphate adenylyltransferase, partial [Candidatus Izemoplasmataceae bacterium]
GVIIHPGAVVKDSVILNDTEIMPGAVIERAIIDKNVKVDFNAKIGFGDDYSPNKERPEVLSSGINVIAKGTHIPENTIIERNCRIYSGAKISDKVIKSGSTIK